MSRMTYKENPRSADEDWDYLWRFGNSDDKNAKVVGILYVSNSTIDGGKIVVLAIKGTSTILSDTPNFDHYREDKNEVRFTSAVPRRAYLMTDIRTIKCFPAAARRYPQDF